MTNVHNEVEEAFSNMVLSLVGKIGKHKRTPSKDWLLANVYTKEKFEWLLQDVMLRLADLVDEALGRPDTPREARREAASQLKQERRAQQQEQLIRIQPILHNTWVRGPCAAKRSDPNWTDGRGWVLEWKVSQLETYTPTLDTLQKVVDFPWAEMSSLDDKPPNSAIDLFSEIGPFGYFFQEPSEFVTFFGDVNGERVKSVVLPQSRRTFRHFPLNDSLKPISSIPQRMDLGSENEPLTLDYDNYWYWYHNRKVKPVPPWHERVFSGYRESWPLLHRDIRSLKSAFTLAMVEQLSRTNLQFIIGPKNNISIGARFTCLYEMLMFLQIGNQFNDGLPRRRCPVCNELFVANGKKTYCGDKCRKKRYDIEVRQR